MKKIGLMSLAMLSVLFWGGLATGCSFIEKKTDIIPYISLSAPGYSFENGELTKDGKLVAYVYFSSKNDEKPTLTYDRHSKTYRVSMTLFVPDADTSELRIYTDEKDFDLGTTSMEIRPVTGPVSSEEGYMLTYRIDTAVSFQEETIVYLEGLNSTIRRDVSIKFLLDENTFVFNYEDAALPLTEENLNALEAAGYSFIIQNEIFKAGSHSEEYKTATLKLKAGDSLKFLYAGDGDSIKGKADSIFGKDILSTQKWVPDKGTFKYFNYSETVDYASGGSSEGLELYSLWGTVRHFAYFFG